MTLSPEHVGHLAALGCASLWAVSTVIFGTATKSVDVRALNFVKCVIAAVLMVLTSVVLGDVPHPSTRDAVALAISAVLGIVIADTGYFVALQELGAARGSLFVALVPVCTAVFAIPVLGEALTVPKVFGMIVTLAGVTLVVRGRAEGAGLGRTRIGVVGGVVYCTAQALANVLTKSADASLSPLALSTFRFVVAGVVLVGLLASTRKGRASIAGLTPVLPRSVVATFVGAYCGQLLGTFGLRTVSAGVATTLMATTPLFAMVIARAFSGEALTPRMVGGAVLAVAGVALLVM